MSDIVLYTIISISSLGIVLSVILYLIAQKFKVFEDPRIDEVEEVLPGANCGGCGYPGCRGFAEACVKADDLDSLFCPVGGNDCMTDVAKVLGKEVSEKDPMIAVIRCSGSPEYRKRTNKFDGVQTCAIANSLYGGDTDCPYGCLGMGDCVAVCKFDAIYIDEKTLLPVVSEKNCTACGACVVACPKNIIELRNIGKKSRRIFVSCINEDKGGIAKKACEVACIGCGKCLKVCEFDAIVIENFKAYIDYEKCKLCRKCVLECPTGAIHELNFPPRKEKPVIDKNEETKRETEKVEEIENKTEVKIEDKTETKDN